MHFASICESGGEKIKNCLAKVIIRMSTDKKRPQSFKIEVSINLMVTTKMTVVNALEHHMSIFGPILRKAGRFSSYAYALNST